MNQRDKYEKGGFLKVQGLFSASEIAALKADVSLVFLQWLAKNNDEYVNKKLVNMHSLTHPIYFENCPGARARLFSQILPKKLTERIDSLFPQDIYFHNTQLFFNPHNNARLPYWHRDLQYSPVADEVQKSEQHNLLSLHIRIPLISETGVELVPGSHKRWDTERERQVRFELDGFKNSDELEGGQTISLNTGDILLFSAQMLHRGNYALNKQRMALDLCVGRRHEFTESFLDASVLPTEEEIVEIDNNDWYSRARDIITGRRGSQA